MTDTTKYPGVFITFEGPEGAGKSTQIKRLAHDLSSRGIPCVLTREPGGTPLAEKLRDVIKHHKGETIHPVSELLLLAAARSQHVAEVIRPALKRGAVVLCDRFADSTEAYQGGGRGMNRALIGTLRRCAVGECEPDLTIVLDLPIEAGFARTRNRAETAGEFDRFETQELAFHQRVRDYFLALSKEQPERVRVINAQNEPEVIQQQVRELVDAVL